jgi:hypothetical protein
MHVELDSLRDVVACQSALGLVEHACMGALVDERKPKSGLLEGPCPGQVGCWPECDDVAHG